MSHYYNLGFVSFFVNSIMTFFSVLNCAPEEDEGDEVEVGEWGAAGLLGVEHLAGGGVVAVGARVALLPARARQHDVRPSLTRRAPEGHKNVRGHNNSRWGHPLRTSELIVEDSALGTSLSIIFEEVSMPQYLFKN